MALTFRRGFRSGIGLENQTLSSPTYMIQSTQRKVSKVLLELLTMRSEAVSREMEHPKSIHTDEETLLKIILHNSQRTMRMSMGDLDDS